MEEVRWETRHAGRTASIASAAPAANIRNVFDRTTRPPVIDPYPLTRKFRHDNAAT